LTLQNIEVQAQGLTVQKKSSSILQFVLLYGEGSKFDPLFITNYVVINVLDELSRTNAARAHLSVNKDAPSPRMVHAVGRILPKPFLGGLHHLV
jgi:hypothetical protein